MIRFVLGFVLSSLLAVRASAAEKVQEPAGTLLPIRPVEANELNYEPGTLGKRPSYSRLWLHAYVEVPLLKKQPSLSLRAAYDLDSLGLSDLAPYSRTLLLHRLELGPQLTLKTNDTASISFNVLAVLSGDLSRNRPGDWQVDARATYNFGISKLTELGIGFEVSRRFGPLVPYPTVAFHTYHFDPLLIRGVLPRDLELYFRVGKRSTLGLLTTYQGKYWWLTGTSTPHAVTFQELCTGVRFHARPSNWLGIDVRTGVIVFRRTGVSGDSDAEQRRTLLQGPGYFFALSLPVYF